MKKTSVISFTVCVMILILTLSVLPLRVNAFSEGGECGEGLSWSLDSETGVLRISGSGVMPDYTEHKSDYDPTQAPWNIYVYRIRSIVVDEGVTCVGSYAFFKCIYASSVTLPDSVTEIGAHAFEKCVSLETIDLAGVKSIGEFAFSGCKALTEYTVDSDAVCANNAFEGAGKRPLGCGGSAFGAAPIAVVIAAAFVLSRKKFN